MTEWSVTPTCTIWNWRCQGSQHFWPLCEVWKKGPTWALKTVRQMELCLLMTPSLVIYWKTGDPPWNSSILLIMGFSGRRKWVEIQGGNTVKYVLESRLRLYAISSLLACILIRAFASLRPFPLWMQIKWCAKRHPLQQILEYVGWDESSNHSRILLHSP